MSKPKREAKRRPGAVPGESPPGKPQKGQTKRIDPAHEVAPLPTAVVTEPAPPEPVPAEPPVAEPVAETPADVAPFASVDVQAQEAVAQEAVAQEAVTQEAVAQDAVAQPAQEAIHVQAEQLAGHLRRRLKELDHRESLVNARIAAIDRDTRAARLWIAEREAELAARGDGLDQRQKELDNREAELDCRMRQAVQAKTARDGNDLAERQAEQARVEAELLREQLRQERQQFSEETRRERRRMADEQRAALAEVEKQREAVRHRAEQVDRSCAALEQLRTELARMHRETLEIRLATEELWVQLSGVAPPAALTSSLSGIRSKLADHYRFANAELQEQKQELESIRRQLVEQYEKVVRQKQYYDRWAQQHQQDAEADASRLAARETELQLLQAELADRSRQWQAQRLEFEQQIRRLTAQRAEHEAVTV